MGIARKSAKAVLWFFGTTLALVVVACVALLLINLEDKPPSKSAVQLEEISASRERFADQDNAYVYLLGFSVGPAEDPEEWGRSRIAWAQAILEKPLIDPGAEFPGEDNDARRTFEPVVADVLRRCKRIDISCKKLLQQNEESVLKGVSASAWLFNRYKKLLERSGWFESVPFDFRLPLPSYRSVLDAQMLLHMHAWIAAGTSEVAVVKRLLEDDIRFWRGVLESSDILITKMIAVEAINRSFSWGNAVLGRLPANQMMEGFPASWSEPLSVGERSMLRCLVGEWQFSNTTLKLEKEGAFDPLAPWQDAAVASGVWWFFAEPMLQPQDSSNRYAESILAIDGILSVPYEQYPQAIERAREEWISERRSTFPRRAYNVVGDILFAMSEWDVTSYAVRVSDLEGVRRVTVAVAELRSRGVSPHQVSDELLNGSHRNPYTGEPFVWDASAGAVVFQGLDTRDRGKHLVWY